MTQGLATASLVLSHGTIVSNGAISQILILSNNMPANLWTNSGGIVRLNTNGPVSISSTGLLGGLVVTQDVRLLGHNSVSNHVWTCTNAATGEGEWRVISSVGTNTAPFSFITTNLLTGQTYTNFSQRGYVIATVTLTNILPGDVSAMSLIVDQNADGTWDITNGPARINGLALLAGSSQLSGLLQPGALFAFTNQSAGVSPSAEITPGTCQWSRW